MQRNCDALSVMLWKKAYPDVDHEKLMDELYEENLVKHLRSVPHLDVRDTYFDSDYSYKRAETVR